MSYALRKTLALFLCLTMCLSLFPVSAFAEDYTEEEIIFDDGFTEEPESQNWEEALFEESYVEETFEEGPGELFFEEEILEAEEPEEPEEAAALIEKIAEPSAEPAANGAELGVLNFETKIESPTFDNGENPVQDMLDAIDAYNSDPTQSSTFTFTGKGGQRNLQLSIPQGFTLYVEGGLHMGDLTVNGSVVVQNGGYLTTYGTVVINGSISFEATQTQTHNIFYNAAAVNGSFTVADGVDVVFMYPVENVDVFQTAIDAAAALDIKNVRGDVYIPWQKTVTIPGGRTVTITGNDLSILDYGGKLVNNGTLNMTNNCMSVLGTLENNGTLNLTRTGSYTDAMFKLVTGMGGSYTGNGTINVHDTPDNVPGYFVGMDLEQFVGREHDGMVSLHPKDDPMSAMMDAIVAYNDDPNQSSNTFTFTGKGGQGNLQLSIPQGFTLYVEGGLQMGELTVDGSVVVQNGGYLTTYGTVVINGSISFEATETQTRTMFNKAPVIAQDATFTVANGVNVVFGYPAETYEEISVAANEAAAVTIPNVRGLVYIPWNKTVTIPGGVTVTLTGNPNTKNNFNIYNYGGKLVNNGTLKLTNYCINVLGTLENNGALNLTRNNGYTDVMFNLMTDMGGSYTGNGTINVHDTPDNVPGYFVGMDLEQFVGREHDGMVSLHPKDDPMSAMMDAIAAYNSDPTQSSNTFTFTGKGGQGNQQLSIPQGFTLYVEGGLQMGDLTVNGSVVVQNGGYLTTYGTVVINGSISFEATQTQTHNIFYKAPVITQGATFTVADGVDVIFMYQVETIDDFQTAIDAAAALSIPNVRGIVGIPWQKTVTIPGERTVTITDNDLSILDYGGKLVNNGTLNMTNNCMSVLGTLENNGTLNLTRDNGYTDAMFKLVTGMGGSYTGNGNINVHDTQANVESYFDGMDLEQFDRREHDGMVSLRPKGDPVSAMLDAIAAYNSDPTQSSNTFTFTEKGGQGNLQLSIPQGFTLYVEGGLQMGDLTVNGSVVVQNGGYLTTYGDVVINGSMRFEATEETHNIFYKAPVITQGATFNVEDGVDVLFNYPVETFDDFQTAIDAAAALDIESVRGIVRIPWDTTVTIPAGETVSITGNDLSINDRGGKLVNNGTLNMTDNYIGLYGAFENNGTLNLTRNDPDRGVMLSIKSTARFEGTGSIVIHDAEDALPSYFDDSFRLDRFSVAQNDDTCVLTPDPSGIFNRFKTACQNEERYFDLDRLNDFTISESITIPANMEVSASGTRIVVPNNVTLTVRGALLGSGLLVQQGGTVLVDGSNQNGVLDALDALEVNGTLTVTNGGALEVGYNAWQKATLSENFTCTNDGYVQVLYKAKSEADVRKGLEAFNASLDKSGVSPNKVIYLGTAVAISDDLTISSDVRLSADIQLTIPEGKTLTVNGTLRIVSETLVLNGSLVNNGAIIFAANANYQLGPNASYSGTGSVKRNGQDYAILTDAERLNALRQAAADETHPYAQQPYDISRCGDFEISSNLTLPAQFTLETYGTNLIVKSGVTLTIATGADIGIHNLELESGGTLVVEDNATFNTYTSFVNNGTVTLGNNDHIHLGTLATIAPINNNLTYGSNTHINIHYQVYDAQTLFDAKDDAESLKEPYSGTIHIQFPWTVTGPVVFENNVGFDVDNDGWGHKGSITIVRGGKLTVDSWGNVFGGTVTIDGGELENNWRIEFEARGKMPIGSISAINGGVYSGHGSLVFKNVPDPDTFSIGIEGLNKTVKADEQGNVVIFTPSAAAIWGGLMQAIQNDRDYYSLSNCGTIEMDPKLFQNGRLDIPDGMHVEAWGTTIVVPVGATLSVVGRLDLDELVLSGSLVMGKPQQQYEGERSHLYVSRLTVNETGTIGLGWYSEAFMPGSAIPKTLRESGRITIDDSNSYMTLNYEPDDANGVASAMDVCAELEGQYNGNINIRFPWTLTSDLTLNPGTGFSVNGDWDDGEIIVPAGKTFTVNGYMGVNGGTLDVYGTLINKDHIDFDKNDDPNAPNNDYGKLILREGGVYSGTGALSFPTEADVNAILQMPHGEQDGFTVTQQDDRYIYHYTGNVLNELKARIAEADSNPEGNYSFEMHNFGDFTLSESIRIPHNLYVEGWGTNLTIPADVILTNEGNINLNEICVNGTLAMEGGGFMYAGTVRIGEVGLVNMRDYAEIHTEYVPDSDVFSERLVFDNTGEYNDDNRGVCVMTDANNDEEFGTLLSAFRNLGEKYVGKIRIRYDMELNENLDLWTNKRVQIEVRSTLTVNEGATLTADFVDLNGGSMTVNGKLISHNEVQLQPNDENGYRPTGTITFAGDQCYENAGGSFFVRQAEDRPFGNHIFGLSFSRFSSSPRDDGMVFRDTSSEFNAFKQACLDNYDGWYNLNYMESFTISESVTIPQNMTLATNGAVIVIPQGVTLGVAGELLGIETFFFGGNIEVLDGGWAELGELQNLNNGVPNGGLIIHSGAGAAVSSKDLTRQQLSNWVSFPEENSTGMLTYRYDVSDEEHFSGAAGDALSLPEHIIGELKIVQPVTLTGSYDLDSSKIKLSISGAFENGALTIDNGAALTVGELENEGGTINVNGSLCVNNSLHLRRNNDRDPLLNVSNGGSFECPVIYVNKEDNAEACINGVDLSRYTRSNTDDGVVYELTVYSLSVGSTSVRRGQQFNVSVDLEEGTELRAFQFVLRFDNTVLRLVDATEGEILTSAPTIGRQDSFVAVNGVLDTPVMNGGAILNLTFEAISDSTAAETVLYIDTVSTVDRERLRFQTFTDGRYVDIPVSCTNGTIEIKDYTLGDVNDDGNINVIDAFMIRRYLAFTYDLNGTERLAADVDLDDAITITDAGYIRQYVLEVIQSLPPVSIMVQ